jgi:hypothetical protein
LRGWRWLRRRSRRLGRIGQIGEDAGRNFWLFHRRCRRQFGFDLIRHLFKRWC